MDTQTLHLHGHMANDVAHRLDRMRPGVLRKNETTETVRRWTGDGTTETKVLLFPTWQEVHQKGMDDVITGVGPATTLLNYTRAYQGKPSASKSTLYALTRDAVHDLFSAIHEQRHGPNAGLAVLQKDNITTLHRDVLARLNFHEGVGRVYVEPRGEYDLVLQGSNAQHAASKINSLLGLPVGVKGKSCFGRGCAGKSGTAVDLHVAEVPAVHAHEPRVGFWMTACAQMHATEQVIARARKFYPHEYIFLVSDCGFDYRAIAEKYNVELYFPDHASPEANGLRKQKAALRAAYGMGTNQYGMDVHAWLTWWFMAAKKSGCDWLVHLEDDVWTSRRHDPLKLPHSNVGIAGPWFKSRTLYSDQLQTWLTKHAPGTVKRPLLPYYNGQGASIVSTAALRKLEGKLSTIDVSILHEFDRRMMRGTDISLCVLMLMSGYDVEVWKDAVHLQEVPNYHEGDDIPGVAFQHGRKDFYDAGAAGAHADLLPWQVVKPAKRQSSPSSQERKKTLIILNARSDMSTWEIGMRMKGFTNQQVKFYECRTAVAGRLRALDFTALKTQEEWFLYYYNSWEKQPASGPGAFTMVLAVSDWWSTIAQTLAGRLRKWPANKLKEVNISYVHLYVPLRDVVTPGNSTEAVLSRLIEFCMVMGPARDASNAVESVTFKNLQDLVHRLGGTPDVSEKTLSTVRKMLGFVGGKDIMALSPKVEHDLVVNLSSKNSMVEVAEEIINHAQKSTNSTKIMDYIASGQTVRPWHQDCNGLNLGSLTGQPTPEAYQSCFKYISEYRNADV